MSSDIAVVIPVFNGARYLSAAIRSVLAQTCPADELVVVDDGSTDDSAAIAESFGDAVRCVRQANRGTAGARNAGLAATSSGWLTFLDADDMFLPHALESHVRCRLDATRTPLVRGLTQHVVAAKRDDGTQFENYDDAFFGSSMGGMLYHRSVFDRVGRLNEAELQSADAEWLIRAKFAGLTPRDHADVVLHYRLHATNLHNDLARQKRALTELAAGAIRLHRENANRRRES